MESFTKAAIFPGVQAKAVCNILFFTCAVAAMATCWTALGGQSVTLAWDPSPDSSVVGYTVRYGTNSGQYGSFLVIGSGTTATVPDLVEGLSYYFSVTAYTLLGLESDPSQELQYTVPTGSGNGPTLNPIGNLVISEDAGQQTVSLAGITAGADGIASLLGLELTATSGNTALIPTPTLIYASPNTTGALRFTPVSNASGTANITVTVNNFKLLNNLFSRVFTVTVNPVNDLPTLNVLNSLSLSVNAGTQTVILGGISSGAINENQSLTVSASSSNPNLIPHPLVNYIAGSGTGSLVLNPSPGASGTVTITVTVADGQSQNGVFSRNFNVLVGNAAASTIYVEAESGVLNSPMLAGFDSRASNGQYIYSGTDYQGTANFLLSIPEAGDYVVWCRVLSVDGGTDSFFVSIDGLNEQSYSTAQNLWSPNWQWSQLNTGALLGPRIFNLSQGAHTLTFRGRERQTLLDALYVTNDRTFSPNTAPRLTLARDANERMLVSFQSMPGLRYELQTTHDFNTWSRLWISPTMTTSETVTFPDEASGASARFYRLQVY